MRLESHYARLYIVQELIKTPFAKIRYEDFDRVVIDLPGGKAAAICIIEREPPLNEILETFREYDALHVHTVFMVMGDMLVPNAGEIFDPPEWLVALHTLQNHKIYAFYSSGNEIYLHEIHLERIGFGTERIVKFMGQIDVRDLGCAFMEVTGPRIGGRWRMADFVPGRGAENTRRTFKARLDEEFRRREREEQRSRHGEASPPEEVRGRLLIYYRMLGVGTDASWDDIKRAYRDLARQYHPDLNSSLRATEKMQQINAAYAHLMSHFDEKTAQQ